MNIFALRGIGGSGKTTSIGYLHLLFIQNNYQIVDTSFNQAGTDFRTIFTKNNKFIGITSTGDTFDFVFKNLDNLIRSGCTICVCACRTFDRNGKGTNAAIDNFPTYQNQYVDKTYVQITSQHTAANQTDAQTLFSRIDALV